MIQINQQFLISVIIPAFNIEQYILLCLESLEEQTLSRDLFEIIIVDDCSTDKTLLKTRNYTTDMNLQIANLDKNGGPGMARNEGINLSRGKYILFLDGDDLLMRNALELLSEAMQRGDYDLITYNWTYFSDLQNNSESNLRRRRDLYDMPLVHMALVQHYLGMNMDGSVIYTTAKKSLFEKYQIRFPGGYHEDMPIIFEMYYSANTILKLDEIIYIKKDVEGSIINTFSKKHVDGYLNSWPIIDQFLQKQGATIDDYMSHYIRGMSGHVCTLISKNFTINPDDFFARILIYKYILEALDRDINLKRPFSECFPHMTEKDTIAQLFFTHMSVGWLPMEERAKLFEVAYHSRS